MRIALARKTAGADEDSPSNSAVRAPFISVAFVAAIFFVPLVIMTGLMTEPATQSGASADLGLTALRGTIDAEALGLRPSQD